MANQRPHQASGSLLSEVLGLVLFWGLNGMPSDHEKVTREGGLHELAGFSGEGQRFFEVAT